jgi:hypothetical protein
MKSPAAFGSAPQAVGKQRAMKNYSNIAFAILIGAFHASVVAAPRELPLRWEAGTCIYGASTSHTIETTYGTNLVTLPFSGTTTYDFYSPPLALPTALTTADKGGGKIFMKNASASHANDFQVTGQMRFYDYDPATGAESLIVDTGASTFKDVNAGQTVNWALPNVLLSADKTVPAGHLLHVAVTLGLVSGNPASFGQLLYNGSRSVTSIAFLSEDNAASWTFLAPVAPSQTANSIQMLADGCTRITCAGSPNQSYLVQATASLSSPSWTTIATNTTGADGLLVFVDMDAPNFPARFYRTSTP